MVGDEQMLSGQLLGLIRHHRADAVRIRKQLRRRGPAYIRAAMRNLRCSLRALARKIGLSPTYLCHVRKRKAVLSPGAFEKLMNTCGFGGSQ